MVSLTLGVFGVVPEARKKHVWFEEEVQHMIPSKFLSRIDYYFEEVKHDRCALKMDSDKGLFAYCV